MHDPVTLPLCWPCITIIWPGWRWGELIIGPALIGEPSDEPFDEPYMFMVACGLVLMMFD